MREDRIKPREISMTNSQRQSITPRIARMLRELEGPPGRNSPEDVATPAAKPTHPGPASRALASAMMIGGGTTAKAH